MSTLNSQSEIKRDRRVRRWRCERPASPPRGQAKLRSAPSLDHRNAAPKRPPAATNVLIEHRFTDAAPPA
jgi:hypothetical protein